MSLVKYDPMNFLNRMQNEMNDFFRQSGSGLLPSLFEDEEDLLAREWSPRVDIKEDDAQFVVTADIPGVDAKDIEVTLENGVLCIKGERRSEKEEKKRNYRLRECSYGSFERRFRMPDTADANKVSAKGGDGVLTVTIGKREAAKPRKIQIDSK